MTPVTCSLHQRRWALPTPPADAGYATVGYWLAQLTGKSPALVVSIACFVTGLIVLTMCVLLQVSLGAGIWLAAALTLALAGHPRFWTNLRAPEVYMPT